MIFYDLLIGVQLLWPTFFHHFRACLFASYGLLIGIIWSISICEHPLTSMFVSSVWLICIRLSAFLVSYTHLILTIVSEYTIFTPWLILFKTIYIDPFVCLSSYNKYFTSDLMWKGIHFSEILVIKIAIIFSSFYLIAHMQE